MSSRAQNFLLLNLNIFHYLKNFFTDHYSRNDTLRINFTAFRYKIYPSNKWPRFQKFDTFIGEPIGHCGVVSRRSKVVVVGTCATPQLFPQKCPDGNFFISSDAEAMMKTLNLRFDTHFDIFDRIILLDTANQNCAGLKSLREYLHKARDLIIEVKIIIIKVTQILFFNEFLICFSVEFLIIIFRWTSTCGAS